MKYLVAAYVMVALTSCTHKPFPGAPVSSSGAIDCPSAALTFNADIQQIFTTSCAKAGCHDGNSMPLDFSRYDQVKPLLDDSAIYYYVVIDRTMPQDTPLTEVSLKAIQCWYLNGYPEK